MNKKLDENIFLKIIKEEWEKEVNNLFEKDQRSNAKVVKGVAQKVNDKKGDDKGGKKDKKKPVTLSPELIDDNLAVGLTIKDENGFEFKITKVTPEYVMCSSGADGVDEISIPRKDLGEYTLA